jgi:cytochrome c oxidase subunit 4
MKLLRKSIKEDSLTEDLAVYAILLALFGLSIGAAFADWGPGSTMISYLIASVKVGVVAWFFMRLRRENGMTHVFAGAGIVWLVILFSLTLSDYMSRGWLPYPSRWPIIVNLRPGLEDNYGPNEQQAPRPGGFGLGR